MKLNSDVSSLKQESFFRTYTSVEKILFAQTWIWRPYTFGKKQFSFSLHIKVYEFTSNWVSFFNNKIYFFCRIKIVTIGIDLCFSIQVNRRLDLRTCIDCRFQSNLLNTFVHFVKIMNLKVWLFPLHGKVLLDRKFLRNNLKSNFLSLNFRTFKMKSQKYVGYIYTAKIFLKPMMALIC